jgi:hypothetical protein
VRRANTNVLGPGGITMPLVAVIVGDFNQLVTVFIDPPFYFVVKLERFIANS